MAVSHIDFNMLGIGIEFSGQYRLLLPDAWKILKDGVVKFGTGNVTKVFGDPGMALWNQEEKRITKKLAFLKKLKCKRIALVDDKLSIDFNDHFSFIAYCVNINPRFWFLHERKGDDEFSWWGPVFEGGE